MNNNQRDPRWANIGIGDGSTTIGTSGCTVSVIGDVLGVTPDVINEKLKAVNGFLGALVIWAKIEEAFPGVKINRVWTYNNDDVLAHVPNVIVEVPAAPIGGSGSHWVNYIGNHQLKDPWTGTVRPTSDFPNPTGYCTFDLTNYHVEQLQPSVIITQLELDQLRTDRDKNWNLYQDQVKVNQAQIERINQLEEEKKNIQEDVAGQVRNLEQDKNALTKENLEYKQANITLNNKIADLTEALKKDATEDADTLSKLLSVEQSLKTVTGDYKALQHALGLTDDATLTDALTRIDTLTTPDEKAVNEYQKLFDVFFEEGLGIYKRFRKASPSLVSKVVNFLKVVISR